MAAKEERRLTARLARQLANEYRAHKKVIVKVLRPFASMGAAPGAIPGAKFKIKEIVRRLDVLAVRWARTATAMAYKSKRSEIAPLAKRAEVFGAIKKLDPAKRSIAELAEETATTLVQANATIERTINSFFAAYEKAARAIEDAGKVQPVQAFTPEQEMQRYIERQVEIGASEQSISRSLTRYLENLIGKGNFVEIGGRFYELAAYAEMVARSELHNIYVKATVDECAQHDCDLVQFSRHDSPCELCAPLEGMVFSISGEDEDFPALDDTVTVGDVEVDPKFPHPNCEHNLNPVTRNILRAAGEL